LEAVASLEQPKLIAQLEQSRARLDALVRKLRAVDHELESLAIERQQHRALGEACVALERLAALGGAPLFWGERSAPREADDALRAARSRVDVFAKRIAEIEERREGLVEQIDEEQDGAEFLEDEVREAEEEEERRRYEWRIERELDVLPSRELVMPWSRGGEEDRRFRKSLSTSLALALLLMVLHSLIDLPLPTLELPHDEPVRFTRLIPARPRALPPITQEVKREQRKPEQATATADSTSKSGPANAPEQAPGAKGILAFRERFSGLADKPVAQLGLQARINNDGEKASGTPERAMLTTQAPGSSGGVNLASLSRGLGGGAGQHLQGVEVARATSAIAAVGDGGGGDRPVGGDGPGPGRTDEEIQIVFDRHKAALYRLYNRELRSDPSLKGQMVLRMRIEPDGSVSLCVLHGSDMDAPQLSAQVVERVKTFDFGAKEVPAITILYPIDFLPAT
jgi:hypothetical protein